MKETESMSRYKDPDKKREISRKYAKKRYKQKKNDDKFVEYHRQKSREWYAKNKDEQNENNLIDYKRHKDKWYARSTTRRLLKEGKIFIEKKCRNGCGGEKFQIHHEEYPATREGIIKSVEDGKIYYLCTKCHNRSNLKVTYQKNQD